MANLRYLPDHLQERVRLVRDSESNSKPTSVIYWMRTAVRASENPALDVARLIASERGVPLLVYHALSEHYRYASDRHHTFILQGARDVQKQLAQLDISYAFYLSTKQFRKKCLVSLANESGILVTEDMPVDPPRRFLDRLIGQTSAMILAVDTACVAPMNLTGQAYSRAFEYRSATKKIYDLRLTRDWPVVNCNTKKLQQEKLPFVPVDLQQVDIPGLVAQCEIDHSVGPVANTIGGTAAGYQRWNQFRDQGLSKYAKKRNDALLGGVSRMSAYLHYGMVSPFRIAREAAQFDHEGAEKYLDELLIWRELAYSFCFFRTDHNQWSALPNWAQQTLLDHSSDPRHVYTWEQLARGKTDDDLWNAAQLSLLIHGELHNNVRMTWGKAILNWTKNPQSALQLIFDLNHRYALDGRDPASYGGILWCLGQFDRPFSSEVPIFGTVRPRPTSVHAKRLPPPEYRKKVTQTRFNKSRKIAVVGAGLSGLFAARTLSDHGLDVTIFEKSRGIGGRMSTRRTDGFGQFDHGAQYFTVRDPRFQRYVHAWRQQGLVAQWPDPELRQNIVVIRNGMLDSESADQQRFVAVPAMNSIGKHLATDLNVVLRKRIASIKPVSDGHELLDDQGKSSGKFDAVVVSVPAEQASDLLSDYSNLRNNIERIEMQPCWAAMISFSKRFSNDWVGAFVHDSFISWIARNSTKPGRDIRIENVVVHAQPSWTSEHWENDPATVADLMLQEFWRVTKCELQTPTFIKSHRWKYALAKDPENQECFFDPELQIGVCGDWANGSRIEGAFLSGMAVAGCLLRNVSSRSSV